MNSQYYLLVLLLNLSLFFSAIEAFGYKLLHFLEDEMISWVFLCILGNRKPKYSNGKNVINVIIKIN